MKANLFIAGACKSGTSYLHQFLGDQLNICPSTPKEPYFFELPEKDRDDATYFKKYFSTYLDEYYLLDGRHRTMFFSSIPKALFTYNPKAKIIFILRNPIERAFSHWWMWYSRKKQNKSFYNALKFEIKKMKKNGLLMEMSPEEYKSYVRDNAFGKRLAYADMNTLIETGYYFKQIMNFKKYFNENQILIIDYEDLNKKEYLCEVLSGFLDTKIKYIPNKKTFKNKAPEFNVPKNKLFSFLPKTLKLFIKNKLFKKPKIDSKSIKLLRDIYLYENRKFIEILDLDFVKKWN